MQQIITQQENQKVNIGDIFVNSWGYDQTNVDFYKVIGMTKACIKIMALKSHIVENGFMCGHSTPLTEFKNEEVITKKLQWHEGKAFIRMEYGWCDLWNGQPQGCSWYA